MSKVIDQKENFNANFGSVFRSSGIFYCPRNLKTTLSVMNYFKEKNFTDVAGVITKRSLSGKLNTRETFDFSQSNVKNFVFSGADEFAVEIEFFSNKNLRIPYAAIMAFYESKDCVSVIHNYGRNHSLYELEEGTALLNGRETCWFVSDSSRLSVNEFLAVFHNGHTETPAQDFKCKVTQTGKQDILIEGKMPKLSPFETYKFKLHEILNGFVEKIGTDAVWFRLEFESESSFPRLLLIEKSSDGEFHVTHSDLDYELLQTNSVSDGVGYTKIPNIMRKFREPILEIDPGYSQDAKIVISTNVDDKVSLGNGGYCHLEKINTISFNELNGKLPSRIHCALSGFFKEDSMVPFRSCLGIVHKERPPKHTHWLPFYLKYMPTVEFTVYDEIYQSIPSIIEVKFKVYSPNNLQIFECNIAYQSLEDVPLTFPLSSIISETGAEIETDEPYYVLINSNYGGFFVFVSHTSNQSLSIEHTF
ncbi:MAG: hypothetical protein CMK25_05700 [Porticoccaceae bacterium]|nr:hypothetical protein [Porticoccaceae bacterium]MDG2116952.1 hypothetical protein [Porticoccaceae bacterium]